LKRTLYRCEKSEISLDSGWSLLCTPQGAFEKPSDIQDRSKAIEAIVPGTAAQSLFNAGRYDPQSPSPLHDQDIWYFLKLSDVHSGNAKLCFDGLASIADIYLNDQHLHQSQSMFIATQLAVSLTGDDEIAICFRALTPYLEKPRKRARWRSAMMSHQGLRGLRTATLGYMPGWCPDIQAVGPWRAIRLIIDTDPLVDQISVRTELRPDGTGQLYFSGALASGLEPVTLSCADEDMALQPDDNGLVNAVLTIGNVAPWWPNSHGPATLHDVSLTIGGEPHLIGRTGFRHVEQHSGDNGQGFGLLINGARIFCRGAVWSSADLLNLTASRQRYAPYLKRAVEAGMNMLRVAGTGTYENESLFELCDELGIMIWQDLMLANFDYPAQDETFMSLLGEETRQLIQRHSASPSMVVLCGGSEMQQQAAMFGLPPEKRMMPELEEMLTSSVECWRPDLITVPNSPFGGALPFYPNSGVAHYFGFGAYRQPISDARRANVSFATECLALSNLPEDDELAGFDVNASQWASLIPKDKGADWNFEDIRDHYLALLYSLDPKDLRLADPQRYLAFSRATSHELVTELYSEFRRHGSTCNGALMLMLQDLMPGCGWGMLGSSGKPKSLYFAAKRIFQPLGLAVSDEATNGLDIHIWNETADDSDITLELSFLRDGKVQVISVQREMRLAPRSSQLIHASDVIGAFFDTNYAYRFGPPSHDVTRARLMCRQSGKTLAEAFHFPLGRGKALFDSTLSATVERQAKGYDLNIEADGFAQSVNIVVEGYLPSDNYFHLMTGEKRTVFLSPIAGASTLPSGHIGHLGSAQRFAF
jgi:beta-mannosidase